MRHLACLVLALAIVGCNERDRSDAQMNAGIALATAKNAASIAWRSFSDEASKVTAESGRPALEKAKQQTAEWQRELSKVKIESPLTKAQADAARAQMAKIQAALNLQNLQTQSKEMVEKATQSGKVAKQGFEDASRKLAEIDEGYKNLRARTKDARAAYDQAAKRLRESMESLRELGKAE